MSIEKRVSSLTGRVSYRVRVRKPGQKPISRTVRTRAMAEKIARKLEDEADRAANFPEEVAREKAEAKARKNAHTLGQLFERYLEAAAMSGVLRRDLTPREQATRKRHLDWWLTALGDVPVKEVTPASISEQKVVLATEGATGGHPLKPATICSYLASLSAAFRFSARHLYWTEVNPVKPVDRPVVKNQRERFLTSEEIRRLLKAAKESGNRLLHPLVVCALATGARRGELLGLHWRDVDLEAGTAVLRHTKNDDSRVLAIQGRAAEALHKLAEVRRIDTGLVFAGQAGTAEFPRKAWKSALTRAKITGCRFHDLRHTFASRLAESGASNRQLAEALGHRSLLMVKRYSHFSQEAVSEVVKGAADVIFAGV